MTRAVAIGQVIQGDKEKPELTDMINSTCAVDLAELKGDDAPGADVCQEYKVVSPLTKTHRTGRGSKVHGGHSTQEEDVVSNWLLTSAQDWRERQRRFAQISGQWGLHEPHGRDGRTLQGIE